MSPARPVMVLVNPVVPVVRPPTIDWLTLIVPWGIGREYLRDAEDGDAFEPVQERLEAMAEEGRCKMWRDASSRYRVQTRVTLTGGAKVLVQFGAKDPLTLKGAIRIDFNPNKLLEGDAQDLHKFIRRAVGKSYDTHLLDAIVNRLDLASDVEHVVLGDLFIDYKGAHEVTMFAKRLKKNKIETMNFGSVSSDYITSVYGKNEEEVHRAIQRLAEAKTKAVSDKLKANLVRQVKVARDLPPTVRFEVRGKKMGVPVFKLKKLNFKRFERFQVSELQNLEGLDEFTRINFLALVRDMGLRAAIAHYKGRPEHATLKEAALQTPDWWQPEGLWGSGIKALKRSGILPADAFKAPSKR